MEAIIKSRFGTKSRAEVFKELCEIVLHEKHNFKEVVSKTEKTTHRKPEKGIV